MNKRNFLLSSALLLAIGFAGAAAAQSPSAALQGSGTPGDVAVVQNVDTGFTREVKVKENGRYQLRNLPTGTYIVTVRHADGGSDEPKQVRLQVGSTARVQ